MQRGCGLARTALLVAEHDNMRRAGLALTSLNQHESAPDNIFKSRTSAVK
jgi:hypothetical protein